jgi:hypothetical protein
MKKIIFVNLGSSLKVLFCSKITLQRLITLQFKNNVSNYANFLAISQEMLMKLLL